MVILLLTLVNEDFRSSRLFALRQRSSWISDTDMFDLGSRHDGAEIGIAVAIAFVQMCITSFVVRHPSSQCIARSTARCQPR
jgi:hypothetical protein